MFRLPKTVLHLFAGALALAALILFAPRAAHAIAATLVQVTNTAANPAIIQSTEKQAAQLLEIGCHAANLQDTPCGVDLPNGGFMQYVPGTQNFVITGADVYSSTSDGSPCTSVSPVAVFLEGNGARRYAWIISPSSVSASFTYSSGIVIPPATTLSVAVTGGACPYVDAAFHGYLTSN